MKCPECNGATTVVNVVYVESENERLRHRRCKVCNHKFYTGEVELPRSDYIERLAHENDRSLKRYYEKKALRKETQC